MDGKVTVQIEESIMIRYAAIAVVLGVMLPGVPSFAVTAQDKMATCKFGADDQKLQGAARDAFMKKCMSNKDEPRSSTGAPVEPKH
jgi:psiF repeat